MSAYENEPTGATFLVGRRRRSERLSNGSALIVYGILGANYLPHGVGIVWVLSSLLLASGQAIGTISETRAVSPVTYKDRQDEQGTAPPTKYELAPNPPLCPKHTEHNTPPKNTPAPHPRRRLSTRCSDGFILLSPNAFRQHRRAMIARGVSFLESLGVSMTLWSSHHYRKRDS